MSTIEQSTKKLNIWYLTIFKDELQHPEDAIYDLSCQQKSKKGKMFYHQVLIYNKLVTFNELKKLYPSARLQKRKSISSALKTINYLKKDTNDKITNVIEMGKLPLEQKLNENKDKNEKEKENSTKLKSKLITVKELKKIKPKRLYFDEYNTWSKVHSEMNCKFNINEIHKNVEVYYIFGPSGVGKTKKAYDIINEHKDKDEKIKFNRVFYNYYCWNGVTDKCEIALYDDFDDNSINSIEFKHFIDHDIQLLNTQNGYIKNNYKLIIITSTQNPQDLFKNSKVDKNQWLSRITKIIDLTPKEDN